ncbi:uncharacterized protein G2W53_021738 [Senna tora]|uniref:Myb/SANT-like domain-containing protein n=1 Tax=Senna tora TaxID=362788 RepID=A0A834WNN4_9FABA|nr:uncharacterized protein G2W53_021738 [Senna tora]
MESKIPGCGLKAIPHIQSRYKTLKASWKEVYDMLYGSNALGFGWDPNRCHKKCVPFRTKPFPLFENLTDLFGKDQANKKDVESPYDVVGEISKETESDIPTQTIESSSRKRQKRQNVDESANDMFNSAVDKICVLMDSGFENATKELCFHLLNEKEVTETLDKLYSDLLLINDITFNEVFAAHIHLTSNPCQLLSYNRLPNDAKLYWIRHLLNNK